jgi:hypothetical protein
LKCHSLDLWDLDLLADIDFGCIGNAILTGYNGKLLVISIIDLCHLRKAFIRLNRMHKVAFDLDSLSAGKHLDNLRIIGPEPERNQELAPSKAIFPPLWSLRPSL